MANEKDSEHLQDLRKRAIESYSPDYQSATDLPLDAHFPLEDPATGLTHALENEHTRGLIESALTLFTKEEEKWCEFAKEA